MLTIEPLPAIAGREFYCLDRLAAPAERVFAEHPVPGHPHLWVVRDARGVRYICALAHLSDVPPSRLYRSLLDACA